MGQKINPTGFRLPVTRNWTSKWFATGPAFSRMLGEDLKVREYLRKKLRSASVGRIVIERPAKNARITIYSARPGVVIGKKGEDIETLKSTLQKMLGVPVHVNIEEIRKPEIDAQLGVLVLRARSAGEVVTPWPEQRVGRRVDGGDTVLTVADPDSLQSATVEVQTVLHDDHSIDIIFDEVAVNGGRPRTCYEAATWPQYGTECANYYVSANVGTDPPTGTLLLPADKTTVDGDSVLVGGWGTDNFGISRLVMMANYDGSWQEAGPAQTVSPFAYNLDLCAAGIGGFTGMNWSFPVKAFDQGSRNRLPLTWPNHGAKARHPPSVAQSPQYIRRSGYP